MISLSKKTPPASLFNPRHGFRPDSYPARALLAISRLVALLLLIAGPGYANTSPSPHQDAHTLGDKTYFQLPPEESFTQKGLASWYGPTFHGRLTSNGERYDMHSLTAAHKTLPMDTVLLVKNLENDRKTVVRVNDRGPFCGGRIIDLSYKAARALGLNGKGTARVQIVAMAEGEEEKDGGEIRLFRQDLDQGEFYVQIGSFARHNNALRLQKRFAEAGHTATIRQAAAEETLLYRVQVYVGKTMQAARNAEKALLESGYKGAFVIAR